ncbi:glycosyltransferase family 2 protein [Acidiphilium iwatense]|nr:glycosyltransferase [Acidiphilium iwatense]
MTVGTCRGNRSLRGGETAEAIHLAAPGLFRRRPDQPRQRLAIAHPRIPAIMAPMTANGKRPMNWSAMSIQTKPGYSFGPLNVRLNGGMTISPSPQPKTGPRLGIAITTFNRREMVLDLVHTIRRLTTAPYDLVICDDGSSDGTVEALRAEGETVIAGKNRGVAWNKNRGIFFLMAIRGCDVAVLLDDDVLPTETAWQANWIDGALEFGHINLAFPDMIEQNPPGTCTSKNPGLSTGLGGPCIAISRSTWCIVGYMDSRFGRFGHEHTEYTNRFLRAGYGGIIRDVDGEQLNYYFVIQGGLIIKSAPTNGNSDQIFENQLIWEGLESENNKPLYRSPWINKEQQNVFISEIKTFLNEYNITFPKQFGIFNNDKYLSRNTDVKNSTLDPWNHFFMFGMKENREIS